MTTITRDWLQERLSEYTECIDNHRYADATKVQEAILGALNAHLDQEPDAKTMDRAAMVAVKLYERRVDRYGDSPRDAMRYALTGFLRGLRTPLAIRRDTGSDSEVTK